MSRKNRILVTDATGIVGYIDPECIGPNETCRRLAQTGAGTYHAYPRAFDVTLPTYHFPTLEAAEAALQQVSREKGVPLPPTIVEDDSPLSPDPSPGRASLGVKPNRRRHRE
jgi:hypothetical protein